MSAATTTATIEQVAALAGVSRSTVSRVVNGSTAVSPTALEAVNRAIRELKYVPNQAARSLASRQTKAIALVVPEDTSRFFGDPFITSVVSGVHRRLTQSDYVLNLVLTSEEDSTKTLNYMRGGNVDGAIVVSHHTSDGFVNAISAAIPVVFCGRPTWESDGTDYYVDVDNVAGGRTATEHLIAVGCTDIATITGPQDMPAGLDRCIGFRDALAAAGLEAHSVVEGDFSEASGASAMRDVLAQGTPDGIFVASDLMARGAMQVIADAGLRIPEDIRLVGFDDSNVATSVEPQLTTVRQPAVEQGALVAERLMEVLAGANPPHVTITDTELVVRDSA